MRGDHAGRRLSMAEQLQPVWAVLQSVCLHYRCVCCETCGATTPGVACQWQNNYSQCGPCYSLCVYITGVCVVRHAGRPRQASPVSGRTTTASVVRATVCVSHYRCVCCETCGATTPGVACQWQNNYSQCGPCYSLCVHITGACAVRRAGRPRQASPVNGRTTTASVVRATVCVAVLSVNATTRRTI